VVLADVQPLKSAKLLPTAFHPQFLMRGGRYGLQKSNPVMSGYAGNTEATTNIDLIS
jgi:hypothetical protein